VDVLVQLGYKAETILRLHAQDIAGEMARINLALALWRASNSLFPTKPEIVFMRLVKGKPRKRRRVF
jgi:hypothetical protein